MERGKLLYLKNCFICHQLTGQGIPGAYPPLVKSDFLLGDKERFVRILCEGLSGEITVNGKKYNGAMPPVVLDDNEAADVFGRISFTESALTSPPQFPHEFKM